MFSKSDSPETITMWNKYVTRQGLTHFLRQVLRYLSGFCCGLSRYRSKYAFEKEPLLPTTTPKDSRQSIHNEAQDQQCVYVMRHGHRQDEEDELWSLQSQHPWNPPLSAKGRLQAREAGRNMKNKSIDVVITSPFLR